MADNDGNSEATNTTPEVGDEVSNFDKLKSLYTSMVSDLMERTKLTTPYPFHVVFLLFFLLVLYRIKVLLKNLLCDC